MAPQGWEGVYIIWKLMPAFQLVILKVGCSLKPLLRPGQRKRAIGWQICSSAVGCGKNDELSVGQMDVMESSSFKGDPFYWGEW